MHDDTAAGVDEIPASLKIAGFLVFVLVGIFIMGPRSAPFLLLLLAAIPLLRHLTTSRAQITLRASPLIAGLVLFGAYLLINSAWSLVPATAYGKAALYFVVIAILTLTSAIFVSADSQVIDRMALNIVLATLFFSGYLLIEIFFGAPIKALVISYFPFLTASQKHIRIDNGWVTFIGVYTFNRNVAAFTLILWPVLLMSTALLGRNRSRWVSLIILAIALPAVAFSAHDTSKLALPASFAIFLLARYHRPVSLPLVAGLWMAATLLAVPLVLTAYNSKLHNSTWIPASGKERIIIWDRTAKRTLQRPILGVGVQSTKLLNKQLLAHPNRPTAPGYARGFGRHSHNIYLQTWFELGAIGALLLCACGLLLLMLIATLESSVLPYILATFTSAMVMGGFSYGMWQPWFMASFGIAALFSLLAIELAARKELTTE